MALKRDLYSRLLSNYGVNTKSGKIDYTKKVLANRFKENPSWFEITYEGNTKDVHIIDINSFKTNPNVKKLLSYPDDVYDIGNYVYWNSNPWLIFAKDEVEDVQNKCQIRKCVATLKWIDDEGNTKSYPCTFQSVQSDSEADISTNKYLELISKDRSVFVQKNDDTDKIFDGKRFLFGKSAYKTGHVDDYSIEGIIQLFLEQDQSNSDTDNFTLGIADYYSRPVYTIEILNGSALEAVSGGTVQLEYQLLENGQASTESVTWSSDDESIATVDANGLVALIQNGTVNISVAMTNNSNVTDSIAITITATPSDNKIIEVTPDIDVLRTNESETFSVVTKNNGSVIASTYTIAVDASSTGDYDVAIASASYTITNNGGSGSVVININDTTNSINIQKTYELKGLW